MTRYQVISDEAREERARLMTALEHAPENGGKIAPGLRGWWTPAGWWICARCTARILARGCSLPRGSGPVWEGEANPYGVCVGCEGAGEAEGDGI